MTREGSMVTFNVEFEFTCIGITDKWLKYYCLQWGEWV